MLLESLVAFEYRLLLSVLILTNCNSDLGLLYLDCSNWVSFATEIYVSEEAKLCLDVPRFIVCSLAIPWLRGQL